MQNHSFIPCATACHSNHHMTGGKRTATAAVPLVSDSWRSCAGLIIVLRDFRSDFQQLVLLFFEPMAHQAYQPVLPCVSKYLQYKWDQSNYDMHRKKVWLKYS